MPERSLQLRLDDIVKAIDRISSFVSGRSYAAFAEDDMCVHAVLYNFQIIGEAVAVIPSEKRARRPEIPWSDIRGMRNVLTHGYFDVDLSIVWTTAQSRLDELRAAIVEIRAGLGAT